MYSASCSWCICRTSGLRDRMEILQLDKPDAGYDRSVDSKYVSVPREEELLDHSGTGNIHECSFHDLFLLCRRVSGIFYEGCLSGRNYPGSSIPWNLYPCDKETNESIVVRQCICIHKRQKETDRNEMMKR